LYKELQQQYDVLYDRCKSNGVTDLGQIIPFSSLFCSTMALSVLETPIHGIIWPKSVTPFDLHLITINPKKDEQLELGDQL
jgi:hypothetical protein